MNILNTCVAFQNHVSSFFSMYLHREMLYLLQLLSRFVLKPTKNSFLIEKVIVNPNILKDRVLSTWWRLARRLAWIPEERRK